MTVNSSLLAQPTEAWLTAEAWRLLDFAGASRHRLGFAPLDLAGEPTTEPLGLFITCRMVHSYAIGELLGQPGSNEMIEHGLVALDTVFRDHSFGGWFTALGENGVVDDTKNAYPHAFVILAASSAVMAGHEPARKILDDVLELFLERFWDEERGLAVESWNRQFTELEDYRGMNSNMHVVEAFLAAADATEDPVWRERALGICEHMVDQARGDNWRIIEHFDGNWRPLPEYNVDNKADPFRPYGSTIGHWFEWARLLVNLEAALRLHEQKAPDWLRPAAVGLFEAATREGWAVDGEPGFVYTVDWQGEPVVRERMHWVVAEAIGAAASLYLATDDAEYLERYRQWWQYAEEFVIDRDGGSWWHELSPTNEVSTMVWAGKPDIYHALQATLFAQAPLTPVLIKSLIGRD